jgi:putative spermidine/putrescine transport system substrate-binding protein
MKRSSILTMALAGAAAFLGALTLPATTRADNASAATKTVITVGIIGGPWIDRIKGLVDAQLLAKGIEVQYVSGDAEDWLPKLIAARGQKAPVDVVEIDDQTYGALRRGDYLAKLDYSKIPNAVTVDPSMRDDYRVAYWAAEPAILYNVDKFHDPGLAPPKTYSDLANPALAGKVLLQDIDSYGAFYEVIGLAYEHGGNESNPKPGFDELAKIHPQSYASSAATVAQLFKAGDIWAAATSAHLGVRIYDSGLNVASAHPVIDGHKVSLARGYLGETKRSSNHDAADAFINAVISADAQTALYKGAATIPTNVLSLKAVLSDVRRDKAGKPFLELDPTILANAWAPNYDKLDRRAWAKDWQDAVAAQ